MRALAPVVEVACDDLRRVARDRIGHEREQAIDLLPTLRLAQAQVHAHRMQRLPRVRHVQHAMKQPARLDPIFEKYAARASEIELESWSRRGWKHRLIDNFYYVFNEML